jgi:hypothetical protein
VVLVKLVKIPATVIPTGLSFFLLLDQQGLHLLLLLLIVTTVLFFLVHGILLEVNFNVRRRIFAPIPFPISMVRLAPIQVNLFVEIMTVR